MKLSFTVEQEAFRAEVAAWLDEQLSGPFADIRGITSQTAAAEQFKAPEVMEAPVT